MKKVISMLTFSILIASGLFSEQRNPIDLIVVMDTSSAMYDQYHEVTEYAISPLLKEFLRMGDTFHLISFAADSRTELSRRIESSGDIETIIARMLLMYPLSPYSDVIQALEYSSQYVSELPETRKKTILFISDGLHTASPESIHTDYNSDAVKNSIAAASRKLRGNGWNFHFIRVPLGSDERALVHTAQGSAAGHTAQGSAAGTDTQDTATPGPSGSSAPMTGYDSEGDQAIHDSTALNDEAPLDVSQTVSDNLLAPIVEFNGEEDPSIISTIVGAVSVRFPEDIGKTGRKLVIPLEVRNPSNAPIYLETERILVDGIDLMDRRSFIKLDEKSEGILQLRVLLPDDLETGTHSKNIEPLFSGSKRINPSSGMVEFLLEESAFSSLITRSLPVVLFLLGLLLAAFIAILILFVIRRLSSAPNRVTSGAVTASSRSREDSDDELAAFKAHAASKRSDPAVYSKATDALDAAALLNAAASSAPGTAQEIKGMPVPVLNTGRASDNYKSRAPVDSVSAPPYQVKKENERIMLSLFVEDQNTAIGKRNVHLLKAGHTLTLGGKRSDFLVFLVPIPHRIADVRFDGETVSIIPRKPQYFPDTGAEPLNGCIGKKIRLISDKGYELFIRLDTYQDPLEKLNKFLHSIELPGVKLI